jgi:hypothetical protein
MNGLLDDFLVGLILLGGFGYAAYALGPTRFRARLLTGLAELMGRLPASLGLRAVAGRLAEKARLKSGGACGGCDNCGADAAPATTTMTTTVTATGTAPTEIRVPLTQIGKRR